MFDSSQKVIVSGLQRSGHHAIAVWGVHQQKGIQDFSIKTLSQWIFYLEHLNDISFLLNNPLRVEEGEGKEHFDSLFSEYEYMNPSLIVATHGVDECTTQDIKRVTSESRIFSSWTQKVLVIRDYYNWVASCLKYARSMKIRGSIWVEPFSETNIGVYIEHCNHAIKGTVPFILYDEWFASKKYRKETAESLGFHFTDAAINQLSPWGAGSSWDGGKYLKNASEMDVLNRYKQMEDDEEYQQVIQNNEEAIDLSNQLFGKVS